MGAKVVLAFSGGLDTSVILKWLINKGYEVICFLANVGQHEDFQKAREKAFRIGASKVYLEDLREEFVTGYIFQALKANALYEGRYLLGTSLARPLIAKHQVRIALEEGAEYAAHGATGKGNDQVRFELTYAALAPRLKVISPWKDPAYLAAFRGRSDMLKYAEEHDIPVSATTKKPYSEDENLMHISHEAGILEDPANIASEDIYSRTVSPRDAPDIETLVDIDFKDGLPVRVAQCGAGHSVTGPLPIFEFLNELGKANGIGRMDMVENRFVGIKSRGIYESPGAAILWAAHRDIEGIAMDKEVMHLKLMLEPRFSEYVYNGFWFAPEMDFLMAAFNQSQEAIDGTVTMSLYKGNAIAVARSSPTSLYNQELGSMDVAGGFDQTDSKGFIRLNSIRLKAHSVILDKRSVGLFPKIQP
ncbi:MAG TPA: argininosuccinate synthase [Magnetospirillaceae bacterium]|nr:argininosuccinate synthase [Magnetospirillaceae bacterium]